MAKKETLKADEIYLDEDLNYQDSSDIDIQSQANPQVKNNSRSPVLQAFKNAAIGAFDGAKSKATDPAVLQKTVETALPKQYGEIFSQYNEISDGVVELYNDAVKKIRPSFSRAVRQIDRLIPTESVRTRGFLQKVKDFVGDDVEYKAPSKEQMEGSTINNTLSAIFKLQTDEQIRQRNEDQAEERIREQVETTRHDATSQVLGNIDANLSRLTQYNDKINQAFQKKTLELQFRGYFLQQEMLSTTRRFFNVFQTQNEAVIKNTALPEYAKITQFESYKENSRQRFVEQVRSGIFGDAEFVKKGLANIRSAAMQKVGDFASAFEEGLTTAEMAAEAAAGDDDEYGFEDGDEEKTQEQKNLDKIKRNTKSLAEYGTEEGMYKLGSMVRRWIESSEKKLPSFIREEGFRGASAVHSLPGLFENFRNSKYLEESYEDNFSKEKLKEIARWGLDQFLKDDVQTALAADTGITKLTGPAIFDNKIYRSISEIIPGYLAHILRELQVTRTGNEDLGLTEFNFISGKFTSKKGIADSIKSRLKNASQAFSYSKDLEEMRDTMLEGGEFSEETKKQVTEFLRDMSFAKKAFDPKLITTDPRFDKIPTNEKKALREFLQSKYAPEGLNAAKNLYKFSSGMRDLKSSIADIRGQIELISNAGYDDILEELDIVRRRGRFKNINTKAFKKLTMDEETERVVDQEEDLERIKAGLPPRGPKRSWDDVPTDLSGNETLQKLDAILDQLKNINSQTALSDVTAKENITPIDPKQALDNIKNTPVFNWKYKEGKGDGKEHVGPMAQDVQKSMGEDTAPGGKKIDLVSMNGQTMAAIEGLRQEFENFKNRPFKTSKDSENYLPLLSSIKKDTGKLVELLSEKGIKIGRMPNFGGFSGGGISPLGNQWFNFSRLFNVLSSAGNAVVNTGDRIGQTMGPIIQDQVSKMPGRLNTMAQLLSSGVSGAMSVGSLLGGKLLNAGGQILKTGNEIGNNTGRVIAEKYQELKGPVGDGLRSLLGLLIEGVGAVGKAAPGMFPNKETAGKIAKFLLTSSPMGRLLALGEMVGGVFGLSKNKLFGNALGAFGGMFDGGVGKHGSKIYKVLKDIREVLNNRLPGEPMVFDEDPEDDSSSLKDKVANFGSKIIGDSPAGNIASKVREKTNELFGNITSSNGGKALAPEAMSKLAKAGQSFMQKNVPDAYKSAQETAGRWAQKAAGNVTGAFTKAASGDFSSLVPNIKGAANNTFSSAKEVLDSVRANPLGSVKNAVTGAAAAVQNPLKKTILSSLKVPAFAAKMAPKAIIPAMGVVGGPAGMAAGGALAGMAGLAGLAGMTGYAGIKQSAKFFGSKKDEINGTKGAISEKLEAASRTKKAIAEKLSNISETKPSSLAKGVAETASSKLKTGLAGAIPTKTPIESSNPSSDIQAVSGDQQDNVKPVGMFDKLTTAAGQFMTDMKDSEPAAENNEPKPDNNLIRVVSLLQEIRDILDVKLDGNGGSSKMPSNATRQGNVYDRMKEIQLRKLQQKSKAEVQPASNSVKYKTNVDSIGTAGKVVKTLWGTKVDGLVIGKDGKPGAFGKIIDKYVPSGKNATLGALATGYASTKFKNSRLGELVNSATSGKSGQEVEAKLDPQRQKENIEDPRKIDTPEEIKQLVGDMLNKEERKNDGKDPTFNDRDDDGDRDGNYVERLEELERRKKEREASRNNQAADNSPRYKSSESIIDKMLGGAKSILGVGGGILSALGGAGSALGGLASLGGLLGGKGRGGPTPTVPGSIPGMGKPQTTVPGTKPSKLGILASRGLKMGAGAGAAYGAFELAEQARANGNETLANGLSMVGNIAGAYTVFQGLSGLANMVAGTVNKTTTLGKIVGAAGSVGSAASSVVGGTTGLVTRAGLSLLGGIGGILASPAVLIPGAVALTAYSGYKLYKYMKKSNLTPIEKYRFAQYGLSEENSDQISTTYALENYFAENALGYTFDKEAYLIEKNIDPKKIADIFGIGENDKDAISKFLHWYEVRFKPIYLSHLTALIKLSPKTRLEDVRDLEPHLKEKYLKAVAYSDGPYDDTTSPFLDLKQLTATKSTVASAFAVASKSVIDELGKENKPKESKESPKKMADFLTKPEDKKEEVTSTDTSLWGNVKDAVSGLASGVMLGNTAGSLFDSAKQGIVGAGQNAKNFLKDTGVTNTAESAIKTGKDAANGFVEGVVGPWQSTGDKNPDITNIAKDTNIDWTTGLAAGVGAIGLTQGIKNIFFNKKPTPQAPVPATAAQTPTVYTPPKPPTKLGIIASRGTKLGLGAGAAYGLASLAEQARANGNETLANTLSMGANAAGAYSAFQGLSGVANLVAGTANKTTLLGKMVGAAGSVGSAASSLVGGTTGLIGRAGLSLLGGFGSMLMSPVVLAPAAVGLAMYGGYKAYKYYKKKTPSTLDKFRFSQYGFSESSPNKDEYYDSAQGLENYFNENALGYKDGQAYLIEKNIKPEEILSIMGISPSDKEGQARALQWLTKRFKPIYLSHMTALAAISPKTRLEDINSLTPEQKEKYLKTVAFPDGPYEELLAPGSNQGNLTADRSYVAGYYQKAYNDIVAQSGKKPLDSSASVVTIAKETATGAAWMGKEIASNTITTAEKVVASDKSQLLDKTLKDTAGWVKNFSNMVAGVFAPASLINFTKQIKRPEELPPTALEMVRFKMYGLTDITMPKVQAIRMMEAYVAEATTIDNSLKVKVTIDGIELLKVVGGTFRVHESDSERSKKWLTWYFKRFLPIFTTYVGNGYRLVQKTEPMLIEKLMSNRQVYDLALKIASISDSWNTQISPYVDEPVNTNTASINGNLKYLEERAAFKLVEDKVETKQELDSTQKSAGEKMESAVKNQSTPVDKNQKPEAQAVSPVSKEPIPDLKISSAAAAANALFGEEDGEGEPSPKTSTNIGYASSMDSKPISISPMTIPKAGGEIKNGKNGMQYVKLEKPDIDLQGMNPAFMTNFLGMAQEYGEKTGKSILVTSANRSYAKQAEIKRNDPSAAKPGHSVHNFGIAMDIRSVDANQLDSLGLLRKYGFTRPIGQELWHIEPAGIQTNIQQAKKDKNFATQATLDSIGKGGGGAALNKAIRKGKRNLEIAIASIKAAEKEPKIEVLKDPVFAKTNNVVPAKLNKTDSNDVGSIVKTSDKPTENKNGLTLASLSVPAVSEFFGFKQPTEFKQEKYVPDTKQKNTTASESTIGSDSKQPIKNNAGTFIAKKPNETLANSSSNESEPKPTTDLTDMRTPNPKVKPAVLTSSQKKVKEEVGKASLEIGADPEVMKTFAAKESSLNPYAQPEGSRARGVFQFMPGTWEMMTKLAGAKYGITKDTPRTDIRASTIMAAEYAKYNNKRIGDLKPNPTATEVYLTHMLGEGGARKLFTANPKSLAKDVLPSADTPANKSMFWNGSIPKTVAGFYNSAVGILKDIGTQFSTKFEDKPYFTSNIAQAAKPQTVGPKTENVKSESPKTETPKTYTANTEPGSAPDTVRPKIKTTTAEQVPTRLEISDPKQTVEPKKETLPLGSSTAAKTAIAVGTVAAVTAATPSKSVASEKPLPQLDEKQSSAPILIPESKKPEATVTNIANENIGKQDTKPDVLVGENIKTLEPLSNGVKDIRNSPEGYMKPMEQVVVSKPSYRYYDTNNSDVVDVRTTVVPAIPETMQPQRLVIDINIKLVNKVSEVVAEQIKSLDKLPKLSEVESKKPEDTKKTEESRKPLVYEEDAIDKLLGTEEMRKKLEEPESVKTEETSESDKPDALGELLKTLENRESSDTLPEVEVKPVQTSEITKAEVLPAIDKEESIGEIIEKAVKDKTYEELPNLEETTKQKSSEVSIDDSLGDDENFVYPDGFVKTKVTVGAIPDKTEIQATALPALDYQTNGLKEALPKTPEEPNKLPVNATPIEPKQKASKPQTEPRKLPGNAIPTENLLRIINNKNLELGFSEVVGPTSVVKTETPVNEGAVPKQNPEKPAIATKAPEATVLPVLEKTADSVVDKTKPVEKNITPDGFAKTDVVITTVPDKTKLEAIPLPLLSTSENNSSNKVQDFVEPVSERKTKDVKETTEPKGEDLSLVPKQVSDIVTNLFDKLKQASKQFTDGDKENKSGKIDVSLSETNPVALTTKIEKPKKADKPVQDPTQEQVKQKVETPKKLDILGGISDVPAAFGGISPTGFSMPQEQPLDQVAGNNLASQTETISIILNESLSVQKQMLSVLKNILKKEPVKTIVQEQTKPSSTASTQEPVSKQSNVESPAPEPVSQVSFQSGKPEPLGKPAISLRRTLA